MFKKILAASVFSLALASSLNAQTWLNNAGSVLVAPTKYENVWVSTQNSATVLNPTNIEAFENVAISCVSAGGITPMSYNFFTRSGRELYRATGNCTTTPTVLVSSTAAGMIARLVVASPTVAISSTNTVVNTIVRTPSVVAP